MTTTQELDLTPRGEASKAECFLRVAETTFKENRTGQYPYIKDLGIETGPLLFLLGHATELLLKAIIRASGTPEKRLKGFKGFHYRRTEGGMAQRQPRQRHRRHDLEFLFRLARRCLDGRRFDGSLTVVLREHRYFMENQELFLDEPERPSHMTYFEQLRRLNANFDTPFRARYFSNGDLPIPDSEVLLVGARFIHETFERDLAPPLLRRLDTKKP